MWIVLQFVDVAESGSSAVFVAQEKARQASTQFVRHFVDCDEPPRAGRAFDFEFVAVVVMELLQRFDEQVIDGEPDRSAPVGIAAEKVGVRLAGLISDGMGHAANPEYVRVVLMDLRNRADAKVGKKLGFVEHALQQLFHAMTAKQGQESALAAAGLLPA